MGSQNDEETVIGKLLPNPIGSFLDIGAHDGYTFSNTYKLAQKGWSGTLVEPSPAAFVELAKVYQPWRHRFALVHAAVVASGPQRMVKFYDSGGDMVSTLSDDHREKWEGHRGHQSVNHKPEAVKFRSIYVSGISVADLCEQFPGPYDLINLDVEGTNYELFVELPLHSLGVKAVCVEFQNKKSDMVAHAMPRGFKLVHETTENLIFART